MQNKKKRMKRNGYRDWILKFNFVPDTGNTTGPGRYTLTKYAEKTIAKC